MRYDGNVEEKVQSHSTYFVAVTEVKLSLERCKKSYVLSWVFRSQIFVPTTDQRI